MEPQSRELISGESNPLRRPKVLLDGRKLGDGGIGVYIDNLIQGYLAGGYVALTVLTSRSRASNHGYGDGISWVFDEAATYSVDEMLLLPRRIDFRQFDLFHSPHYTLPFGIPIPKVVTVHDLIHITHPERFYYPFVATQLIRSAVRRADGVVAVSRDTRRALIELTGAPQRKVRYIPNAVSSCVTAASAVRAGVIRKYADLSPYILAVFSNIKPHKGLRDLITAFHSLRSVCNAPPNAPVNRALKLVLAGYGTEEIFNSPELLSMIGDNSNIHILGRVSNEELFALYSRSKAVAIPSYAEGFCLPALEAQSLGAPVVCRPVPALCELVTDRDVVAADFSIDALTAALSRAAHRDIIREEGSAIEQSRVLEFGRTRVAQQTAEFYAHVLQERKS